jgi:hypothetical protein
MTEDLGAYTLWTRIMGGSTRSYHDILKFAYLATVTNIPTRVVNRKRVGKSCLQ